MERDFMGLNSKDSVITVKEAAFEGFKELGVDGFEGSKNSQIGEIRKSIGLSRPGGTHYSMAAYPMQQSPFSMQLVNDAKQAVPISMSHPFFKTRYGGPSNKQHPVSVPSIGSFLAGTTEPWYSPKASCAPSQLTIFYGGMVNVYDDISPEKAQAIMFLAGNGASASTPQPRAQTQIPDSRIPVGDVVYVTQPINAQPCSAISNSMSVSSHPVGPTNKDEGAKTICGSGSGLCLGSGSGSGSGSVTPVRKVDTPRVINSIEKVTQSAVPQARKASLARFLEKRKERTMASAPYNVGTDLIGNSGSSSMNVVTIAEN